MINPLFLEINGEQIKIVTQYHCGYCGAYGLFFVPGNDPVLFPMFASCMECAAMTVVMKDDVLWQKQKERKA